MQTLATNPYPLIVATALRLGLHYISEDLRQDCALACVRAMARHDPARGAISTYLVPRIRGTILDSIRPPRGPGPIARANAIFVTYDSAQL